MAKLTVGDYLRLIKSGIIMGNSLHYIVGLLIAVPTLWSEVGRGAVGLAGTALLIASACLVNNWLDRDYDKAMKRAAVRATARGEITARQIYIAAAIMGVTGLALLLVLVNPLTATLGAVAWVSYSVVYTLSKPRTAWSTIIGTVPGALPAVAGYTAVTGQMTAVAWWLFALIAAWQLPHFYAIAVYRRREYQRAKIPVLSTIVPKQTMRWVIVGSLLLYLVVAAWMAWVVLVGLAGVIVAVMAAMWLWRAWPYDEEADEAWARRLFGWSMYVSLGLVVASVVHLVLSLYL